MRPLLRVLVCGSVDDGKSTLIGRLLHDTGSIPPDQIPSLVRHGVLDLSLLTDGLEAEREQGITIDVAYRGFRTPNRRFLLLDCPGHEQYTRNMATGASGAELAVLLVDAARGVQVQTRRHMRIARLMGIRSIVCVVNKMDLVGYSYARFAEIASGLEGVAGVIPASATEGGGISALHPSMGWYDGPTLLDTLEAFDVPADPVRAFRMQVQWVIREPDRLYAGTVAAGRIAVGEAVAVSGSPDTAVARIIGPFGSQETAEAGQAVSLALTDHRDCGRGNMISAAADPVSLADQFQAQLVWCSETPLLPGRAYLFKFSTQTVAGSVTRIRHAIDVDTGLPLSADTLQLNDIGVVNLSLASKVPFEPFADSRALGAFIIIDRQTNATTGAGTIDFALRRSSNSAWHTTKIDRAARARLMGQRPMVVWFTGLSGAGKSTVANLVEAGLHSSGRRTALLDGDNLRHGLCRDLGFTASDRVENVRRVGEVAALMADAGLIVLVCLISPYRADRQAARDRMPPGEFLEVFVDAPIAECRKRDPKGLYNRADRGKIPNFTGVSAPYEAPATPELHLRTDLLTPEDSARAVLRRLMGEAV